MSLINSKHDILVPYVFILLILLDEEQSSHRTQENWLWQDNIILDFFSFKSNLMAQNLSSTSCWQEEHQQPCSRPTLQLLQRI